MVANTADPAAPFHVMAEDHPENGVQLGFWVYLMSDSLVFAVLFGCYAVYAFGGNPAYGPHPGELVDLKLLAVSTAALLLSSLTYGFGMLALDQGRKAAVLTWLAIAGAFALVFLGLEVYEFSDMVAEGAGPGRNAALSSFFTLVGTHGLHVTFGTVWLVTFMIQVGSFGLTSDNKRRLTCLGMYWHFLDLVWVGIFSFVYLVATLQ